MSTGKQTDKTVQ